MAVKTDELKAGMELPPVSRTMTLEKMRLFSGWPAGERYGRRSTENQHTSDEVARALGRPGAIVQGLQLSGYIEESLLDAFGEAWLTTGALNAAYIGVVLARDVVTTRAKVEGVAPEGQRRRVTLDVWLENQRGERVVTGTASVLV